MTPAEHRAARARIVATVANSLPVGDCLRRLAVADIDHPYVDQDVRDAHAQVTSALHLLVRSLVIYEAALDRLRRTHDRAEMP